MAHGKPRWAHLQAGTAYDVKIVGAKNLISPSPDRSLPDPFCTCEIVNKPSTKLQTAAAKATKDPVWDLHAAVEDVAQNDMFSFNVWDQVDSEQPATPPVSLGFASVQASLVAIKKGFIGDLKLIVPNRPSALTSALTVTISPAKRNSVRGSVQATGRAAAKMMALTTIQAAGKKAIRKPLIRKKSSSESSEGEGLTPQQAKKVRAELASRASAIERLKSELNEQRAVSSTVRVSVAQPSGASREAAAVSESREAQERKDVNPKRTAGQELKDEKQDERETIARQTDPVEDKETKDGDAEKAECQKVKEQKLNETELMACQIGLVEMREAWKKQEIVLEEKTAQAADSQLREEHAYEAALQQVEAHESQSSRQQQVTRAQEARAAVLEDELKQSRITGELLAEQAEARVIVVKGEMLQQRVEMTTVLGQQQAALQEEVQKAQLSTAQLRMKSELDEQTVQIQSQSFKAAHEQELADLRNEMLREITQLESCAAHSNDEETGDSDRCQKEDRAAIAELQLELQEQRQRHSKDRAELLEEASKQMLEQSKAAWQSGEAAMAGLRSELAEHRVQLEERGRQASSTSDVLVSALRAELAGARSELTAERGQRSTMDERRHAAFELARGEYASLRSTLEARIEAWRADASLAGQISEKTGVQVTTPGLLDFRSAHGASRMWGSRASHASAVKTHWPRRTSLQS
eukprot:TRINITY_DN58979_c0_g1_i1.p1 TRINITY_DN58979_c0_g1~~TRINITY_DN58979_c0_g1_i1.p1  ORF type:complete len:698 (-),score=143.43 TRINITY_DN58979_c0_g1_i1:360-2453(-)